MVGRRRLSAAETVIVVVVLTVAEYLVKICYSPAAFTYSDELAHWRGTVNMLHTGKLFTVNYLLPIGPRYPGLEEATAALASVTRLSVFDAGLIVAGVSHLLFICVLYILFRHICASYRTAGLAVLLYASNPLFQSFDSMFVYQTVALPFLGLALLATWQLTRPQSSGDRAGWLTVAVLSVIATVVTHHVTSYVLLATLVIVALGAMVAGDGRTRNWAASLALLAALAIAGWLVLVAPQTVGYLRPAAEGTLQSFRVLLTSGQSTVHPISSGPLGNRMLGTVAVLAFSALLPFGWWQIWRRHRLRPWAVAMAFGSVLWYVIVAVRLAVVGGSELAGRAATFVYVPACGIAAFALAGFMSSALRQRAAGAARPWRASAVGAASLTCGVLLMFDGLANGWPPYWERLPGPHQVAGAERSAGPEETATAKWALAALGPGNRFAADVGSYPALGGYGDQNPVRDIGYLYTAPTFTRPDALRARQQAVHYILVDRRLAEALPASGQYFPVDPNAGRYSHPLPPGDLAKFNRVPGIARVYDSGNIVIYDLAGAEYAR
jgi:hypothetical protein